MTKPLPLQPIGLLIRAAREQKGFSQERAAKAARVSRQMLSRLEEGRNVSVLFLQKVLAALDATMTIGDGTRALAPAANLSGIQIDALLQLSADLAVSSERARVIAFEAALPPSERDASTLAEFIEQRASSAADASTLTRAISAMASDDDSSQAAPATRTINRERSRRRRGV